MEMSAEKTWVCWVVRSGFHNGAGCRPSDAHHDGGCGWHWNAKPRSYPTK